MKRNAFTIIELLVSIMIIGILATFGYKQYTDAVDKAKSKGLAELIKKFNTGISSYFNTYNMYPDNIYNAELLKILTKEMEFTTNGLTTTTGLKVLTNLGPKSFFDIKNDFTYVDSGKNNAFRYIVVRNVPVKLAALTLQEINGVNNPGTTNTVDCKLPSKNWFAAITVTDTTATANLSVQTTDLVTGRVGTLYPSTATCVGYDVLMSTAGGENTVDLWYTFSRSLDTGNW